MSVKMDMIRVILPSGRRRDLEHEQNGRAETAGR